MTIHTTVRGGEVSTASGIISNTLMSHLIPRRVKC